MEILFILDPATYTTSRLSGPDAGTLAHRDYLVELICKHTSKSSETNIPKYLRTNAKLFFQMFEELRKHPKAASASKPASGSTAAAGSTAGASVPEAMDTPALAKSDIMYVKASVFDKKKDYERVVRRVAIAATGTLADARKNIRSVFEVEGSFLISISDGEDLMPVETNMDLKAINCDKDRLLVIPTAAMALADSPEEEHEEEEDEEAEDGDSEEEAEDGSE